jgi:hypothetical protein
MKAFLDFEAPVAELEAKLPSFARWHRAMLLFQLPMRSSRLKQSQKKF